MCRNILILLFVNIVLNKLTCKVHVQLDLALRSFENFFHGQSDKSKDTGGVKLGNFCYNMEGGVTFLNPSGLMFSTKREVWVPLDPILIHVHVRLQCIMYAYFIL